MGPFVVTLPSIVSSLWFPPGQRTVATGLSWLLLETGNALGFILGPLVVRDVRITVGVVAGSLVVVGVAVIVSF